MIETFVRIFTVLLFAASILGTIIFFAKAWMYIVFAFITEVEAPWDVKLWVTLKYFLGNMAISVACAGLVVYLNRILAH